MGMPGAQIRCSSRFTATWGREADVKWPALLLGWDCLGPSAKGRRSQPVVATPRGDGGVRWVMAASSRGRAGGRAEAVGGGSGVAPNRRARLGGLSRRGRCSGSSGG
jgi:hypothetical protein